MWSGGTLIVRMCFIVVVVLFRSLLSIILAHTISRKPLMNSLLTSSLMFEYLYQNYAASNGICTKLQKRYVCCVV